MNYIYAVPLLAFALTSVGAEAVTFPEAVDFLTENNPDVIKARLEAAAARADIKVASALPDPQLNGEYMWTSNSDDNRWNAGVEWGFEWFGVYGARRDEARAHSDAFTSLALSVEAEQRQEIANTLTEWQTQKQKVAVLERMAEENTLLLRTVNEQEKGGRISRLDANKIAIENARFNVRIEEERLALQDITRRLVSLSGGRDVTSLLQEMTDNFDSIKDILPPEEEVVANSKNMPAVRAAIAGIESARRGLGVAKAESGPGITLGYNHLYEDGMHFNGISVGLTLPFFSSRGKKEAARARIIQAEFEASATLALAEAEARSLWKKAEALRSRLEPLREVFEMSDNFALLRQQYEGGQISLADYQTERLYFMEAELEYLGLRAQFRKAVTALYTLKP